MQEKESHTDPAPPPVGKPKRRWKRRIGRFLLFIALLFVVLILLLQSTWFQNWAVDRVTHLLSRELDARVSLERVELDIFSRVVLEGLHVEDLRGDTLINAHRIKAGFESPLLSLFGSKLKLDEVTIEQARFYLHRDTSSRGNNLAQLLWQLNPPREEKKEEHRPSGTPLQFSVQQVHLRDIQFREWNEAKGNDLRIFLENGILELRETNFPEKQIRCGEVKFEGFDISVYEGIGQISVEEFYRRYFPEPDTLLQSASPKDTSYVPFQLFAEKVQFQDSRFRFDNDRREKKRKLQPGDIDYDHLRLYDIQLNIDSFRVKDLDFQGQVREMALRDSTGFVLESTRSDYAHVHSEGIELLGLDLVTPFSHLRDTLRFDYASYEAFKDFENQVIMKGWFDSSYVSFRDIMTFAPELKRNPFFVKNRESGIRLEGTIRGTVNNLKGRDLFLQIGSGSYLQGDFSIRDVTDPNITFFALDVNRLQSSMQTLRLLLPGFDPPANYNSLGALSFAGKTTGYFYDFVAEGQLNTALGKAEMDMKLNTEGGPDLATYSGSLSLNAFDLGAFTGDSKLGDISFTSSVKNGQGLTAQTANALLTANVSNFTYSGYTYQNINLNGQLNQDFFNGNFAIQDDNIDLDFQGSIRQMTTNPRLDLRAQVEKFDFYQLKLMNRPFSVKGIFDVDLLGQNISKLYGKASIRELGLFSEKDTFYIDSIFASSQIKPDSSQSFRLQSELVEASADGLFDLAFIHQTLLKHFQQEHGLLYQKLGLPVQDSLQKPADFQFSLKIIDTKNLMQLLGTPLDTIQDLYSTGYFSNTGVQDSLQFTFSLPQLKINQIVLDNIELNLLGQGDQLDLQGLFIDRLELNEELNLTLSLLGGLSKNQFNFFFQSSNLSSILNQLNLEGQLGIIDSALDIRLANTNIGFLQEGWTVKEGNRIRIGPDYVDIRNFVIDNGEQRIALEQYGPRGMRARMEKVGLELIDELWNYPPLSFSGPFDATFSIRDVFQFRGLQATLGADRFQVNQDNWGSLSLKANAPDLKHPIQAYLHIGLPEQERQLVFEGFYNPAGMSAHLGQPDYFEFDLTIDNYPFDIVEYWIAELVSDTRGTINAQLELYGPPTKPNISGNIQVEDGSTFVEYLQTRYTFDPHTISVDNYLFDGTGVIIRDPLNNAATVIGGISHDHLKNMGLNVQLVSDRFLSMNTRKEDNELFYGYAMAGDLDLTIRGPFDRLDMGIKGTSLAGTSIKIPFAQGGEAGALNFIRFVEPDTLEEASLQEVARAKGLNINMQLKVTEEAEIQIIFDEKSGDIIKGKGSGDLEFELTRTGEFSMSGQYTIAEGEYLFTLYDLVNKPFSVKPGGWIRWTGDPYGAQISIDATYGDINTPLTNFLDEFLETAPDDLVQQAAQPTEVTLILELDGDLMQPDISFDVEFPNLVGPLRSLTDSRMLALERNPNELNYQVFGLIVTKSFLPSQSGALLDKQYVTGINTVSELLANQLSRYLTDLVSEVFTDVSFVSGVDLDIAATYYEGTNLQELENPYIGTEVEVNSNFRLINDKVVLRLGGNYSQANSQGLTNNQFFSYDVILELALTKDKRYKLRFYHRTEPELTGGLETRTGLGLVYRRDFDSFGELLQDVRKIKNTFKPK